MYTNNGLISFYVCSSVSNPSHLQMISSSRRPPSMGLKQGSMVSHNPWKTPATWGQFLYSLCIFIFYLALNQSYGPFGQGGIKKKTFPFSIILVSAPITIVLYLLYLLLTVDTINWMRFEIRLCTKRKKREALFIAFYLHAESAILCKPHFLLSPN